MFRRLFLLASLPVLLALGWLVLWKPPLGATSYDWVESYLAPKANSPEVLAFEKEAEAVVLAGRIQAKVTPLILDPELKSWMQRTITEDPKGDLTQMMEQLQAAIPQYVKMTTLSVRETSAHRLMHHFEQWRELNDGKLTHAAIVMQPLALSRGWQGYIVAGQRVPDFSPEGISRGDQHIFYTRCSLCGKGQPCEVPRHTRTLSLKCQDCQRIYTMVATDTDGNYHYVNEYLTGYAPPAHFAKGLTPLQEMLTIWHSVSSSCRYTPDDGEQDSWQTPLQTQMLGRGDCEDTSIQLADWLIARGFQARVALGRLAERGGHAWVVVHLDGKDYLLESTEGGFDTKKLPYLKVVGARYEPEVLFDREAFYIRKQEHTPWNGDLWSEKYWERIPQQELRVTNVAARGE